MSTKNIELSPELKADREYCAELQTRLGKKSAVIRYLAAEGWSRGRIAKGMDIIYQHVRNTLVKPLKKVTIPEMVEGDL
jgi:hypothetical protein